jgi:lysylphosphatidylglycerol synthetase-like protein (DUF2156 family)
MTSITAPGSTARATFTAGAIGGLVAAVANLVVYLIATALLRIDLLIPQPPDMATLGPLPFPMVLIASFVPGLVAAGLLLVLRGNKQLFTIISVVALVLSMIPLLATGMATQTAIVLGIMHVVAAVAIVGVLTRRA